MQEIQILSLGQEDPMEKEKATHSTILVWEIQWIEKSSRLQFMGLERVGHDLATKQKQQQTTRFYTIIILLEKLN